MQVLPEGDVVLDFGLGVLNVVRLASFGKLLVLSAIVVQVANVVLRLGGNLSG